MHFKPEAKTIFLILGSKSPENEADLRMQKETWLQDLLSTQSYLVLRGSDAVLARIEKDELYLPVIEAYGNILLKTILGMQWALENSNFDVMIRTNVSTYFPPGIVEKVTESLNTESHYFGGYVDQCRLPGEERNRITEYVAGTGLILSRPTVKILCDMDWSDYHGWPDDLALSMALKGAGILPDKIRRNNLSQLHFFAPAFQIRLKTSSVSFLASQRMRDVHKYFHASGRLNRILRYLLISVREIRYALINREEILGFITLAITQVKRLMLKNRKIVKC